MGVVASRVVGLERSTKMTQQGMLKRNIVMQIQNYYYKVTSVYAKSFIISGGLKMQLPSVVLARQGFGESYFYASEYCRT